MRRRDFITLLGGAAAWPLAAQAQQPVPVIGFLSSGSLATFEPFVSAFRKGLSETGYNEGRNVAIEYRWADGEIKRLPALAADLVRRRVAVIAATGGSAPALAAKAATATLPIVFTGGGDPVQLGLVDSLNRPGGNATGATNITTSLDTKRLQLLHDLVPTATVIACLANPTTPGADIALQDLQAAARMMGLRFPVQRVDSDREIDTAFAVLAKERPDALLVGTSPLFTSERESLVSLAAHYRIPASYTFREFVTAGGLMSYGPSITDGYRQAGVYVGRILKGEKPADIPVQAPTKFDLVINLKTAKALGLMVSREMQLIADEILE